MVLNLLEFAKIMPAMVPGMDEYTIEAHATADDFVVFSDTYGRAQVSVNQIVGLCNGWASRQLGWTRQRSKIRQWSLIASDLGMIRQLQQVPAESSSFRSRRIPSKKGMLLQRNHQNAQCQDAHSLLSNRVGVADEMMKWGQN
ncbi:unnamed protein product [Protopolystoma xenopodis]|uniref:Uncharacterized protein n=1 Tax=Protopolystoma xenopodis TaxID=117903 RepID=A0A3S5CBG5_9PLAT|nr:unnamed protein product [Protopolystoma xenopodis]